MRKFILICLAILLLIFLVGVLLKWQVLGVSIPFGGVNHILSVAFSVIYALTSLTAIYAINRENGNPSKTIAWVLIIFALPIVSIILYSFLGKSLQKEKLFSRKQSEDLKKLDELAKPQVLHFESGEIELMPAGCRGEVLFLSKRIFTQQSDRSRRCCGFYWHGQPGHQRF